MWRGTCHSFWSSALFCLMASRCYQLAAVLILALAVFYHKPLSSLVCTIYDYILLQLYMASYSFGGKLEITNYNNGKHSKFIKKLNQWEWSEFESLELNVNVKGKTESAPEILEICYVCPSKIFSIRVISNNWLLNNWNVLNMAKFSEHTKQIRISKIEICSVI